MSLGSKVGEPRYDDWRTLGRWLGNLGLVVVNTIYNNRTGLGQQQNGNELNN